MLLQIKKLIIGVAVLGILSLLACLASVNAEKLTDMKPLSNLSETTNWLIVGNRIIDLKVTKQKNKRWLAKIKIQEIGEDKINYKTIGQYNTLNNAEDAAGIVMAVIEEQHLVKIGDEVYRYIYDGN